LFLLGADIGGTFTDIVEVGEDGEIRNYKTSTTPGALSDGIVSGLELLAARRGAPLARVLADAAAFLHGTTTGTNALIQGKLGRVGLLATKGFGDTLVIRRALKGSGVVGDFVPGESLYDAQMDLPKPLVPRSLTVEVTERVNYEGEVLTPLDLDECAAQVQHLVDHGVDGIAVCLLWSPMNSAHEEQVMEVIKRHPAVYENSSYSADVVPQIREYERMSSVVLDSALKPIMRPYLKGLVTRLRAEGLPEDAPVLIMQLFGGVAEADRAAQSPVATIGSGPVGGVVGAQTIGGVLGYRDIVTMDMGGTSFDVGVVKDGEPLQMPVAVIERYHLMVPMIDVRSVGAGGGSLAQVHGGTLSVGPQSAQAQPGPACYGRGGTIPTVTDANLVLGYLGEELAGGEVLLDVDASRRAIQEHVAEPLGLSVEEAAVGIVRIAEANMINEIRLATTEKGIDLDGFAAFIYGGAGPIHGASLCKAMNITTAVVPRFASTFSALGVALSPYKHAYVRPLGAELLLEIDLDVLNAGVGAMLDEARQTLTREGVPDDAMTFGLSFDMRFAGQLNEMAVAVPLTESIGPDGLGDIEQAFIARYSERYTYVPDFPVEVVAARVEASGHRLDVPLSPEPLGEQDPSAAAAGTRQIYSPATGARAGWPIYDGRALRPGNVVPGPAVVDYPDTSVVVGPGQSAQCDGLRNLVIDIVGAAA
jgi:N-methylhydantoinase A